MTVQTSKVVLGQHPTPANNFLLDTDLAGALRWRRNADGSGGNILSADNSGNLRGKFTKRLPKQIMNTLSGYTFALGDTSDINNITVCGTSLSTAGGQMFAIQLGGAAIVTSGYTGGSAYIAGSSTVSQHQTTAGFGITNVNSGTTSDFTARIMRIDDNRWHCSYVGYSYSNWHLHGHYTLDLAEPLTQLRVTTAVADTYDNGFITVVLGA